MTCLVPVAHGQRRTVMGHGLVLGPCCFSGEHHIMKPCVFLLLLLFLFLYAHAVSAQEVVSLATTEWKPYVGKDLKGYGFVSEIIAEAFKRVGYRVRYEFMPPKRVMKQVEAGEYDAGYPAYHSEDRAKRFHYSDPFADSAVGFFKRKDSDITYNTLRDLAPFKIGVCLGFAYPPTFTQADYLKKEVARNEVLNLRKLVGKRIDLFITDRAAAQAAINASVPEGKEMLEFMEPPLETRTLHLIFGKRQRNESLRKDFNTGLQMIIQDGTVEKILKKHGIE